jgi:sporulation protein YlmC with PRC-barrel domain
MAKQPKEKAITKDRLVGMKVLDGNGYVVGTITDIGFTVGKTGISLTMEDKQGETREIPWDQVQGAGDFVLLKPATETVSIVAQQPTMRACPVCRGPLRYVEKNQEPYKWWCDRCNKYV